MALKPTYTGVLCGTSATKITLAPCGAISIANEDRSATLYVGTDATVTISTGYPVPPKTALTFDFGEVLGPSASPDWYGVCSSGTVDARYVGRT